ncbi:hypothetical protein D3C78_944950 [compost metagenome]
MAAGGYLWGSIASQASTSLSIGVAALGLILGVVLTLKVHLPVTQVDDLAPSLHWPAPLLSDELDQERGPVLVTVEYHIAPEYAAEFQRAMGELELVRRRNGALSWGLMQDSSNPRLWLEFFFDESWLEHLRHHQRVTRGELKTEAAVRRLQSEGVDIRIRHYLKGAELP